MDVKLLKRDDKAVEISVSGDKTIAMLIRGYLLQDENVDFAAVAQDHPLVDEVRIFVRVKNGDPLDAVKSAIERAKADLIQLQSLI
ncbi:MAG: DNA-directed RNA polymerase subunit L [Candidatus Diapherotrites archaeon]|nr:DNA-directed RNA polymerase subunit L [Candidatus Diapherotrites archaeon]